MTEVDVLYAIVATSQDHYARLLSYRELLDEEDPDMELVRARGKIIARAQRVYNGRMEHLWEQREAFKRDRESE